MIVLAADIDSTLVTARGMKQITRLANRLEMVKHKVERLPLHFQNVPQTRPGGEWQYAKRDKKYQIRKARKHRHQRPNVFSGELERKVLSSARVTATETRGRLIARGSTKSRLTDQRRAEIEAVATKEQQEIAASWGNTVSALMGDPKYQKKTRRRNAAGKFIKG